MTAQRVAPLKPRTAPTRYGLTILLLLAAQALSSARAEPIPSSTSIYTGERVLVKWRTDAGVGGVSAASVGPTLQQVEAVPVPWGLTAEEYIESLLASGAAEYAEPNYPVSLLAARPLAAAAAPAPAQALPATLADDPLVPEQYHLKLTGTEAAWQSRTSAEAIKVCIVDTGVDYSHPDLEGNLSESSFNSADGSADASDEAGHGTMVAGIIGAAGNNSLLGSGMAWGVELLPCKPFLGESQATDLAAAVGCLQWCIEQGAQVSSNSWGLLLAGPPPQSLQDVLKAADSAGHVAVFAAGNNRLNLDVSDAKVYPAALTDLPNMISVASTGRGGGRIARRDGTNFGGRTVSLAAPGVDILSTALGGNMTTGTGTSFAAPQVAGAVALLLAEAQARGLVLQPCEVKALLLRNVWRRPALKGKVQAGGVLNTRAALQALVAGDIPACSWPTQASAASPAPAAASP